MKQFMRMLFVAGGLLAAVQAPAAAQRSHIGFHAGYNFDIDEALVGGQILLPIAPRVELYPSIDYYFVDPSLLGFNLDLKFRAPGRASVLYFGGGLNFLRVSGGNTDTGGNLFAGLESRLGMTHPYFEGRLMLHDNSTFQLVGGLNLTLF